MKPKRRPRVPFVPKKNWILGTIYVKHGETFVDVQIGFGVMERWTVTDEEAWNHDVYHGLKVYLVRRKAGCFVVSRAEKIKQFVKISYKSKC